MKKKPVGVRDLKSEPCEWSVLLPQDVAGEGGDVGGSWGGGAHVARVLRDPRELTRDLLSGCQGHDGGDAAVLVVGVVCNLHGLNDPAVHLQHCERSDP